MQSKQPLGMWKIGVLTWIIFWTGSSCVAQTGDTEPARLEAYSRIAESARNEVSGMVKSRKHENVFWVHGDSGNEAKVFPVKKNGEIASTEHLNGVELDIKNIDWEDISFDESGNLIVADIGNNCFCRENLSFLIFPEPDANATHSEFERIKIQYPERSKFIGLIGSNSPDAEAVFYKDEAFYVITKESDGDNSMLYKLESPEESIINTLTGISSFNFDDKVTAADISEDGDSLAVLTSSSVWLFTNYEGEDFFSGSSQKMFFQARQVESVAFSGEESLLIAEEEGQLYEIPFSKIK